MDVPLARALDILDNHFEGVEVQSRHRVEADVEEDQGPFEEGVDCVGWRKRQYAIPRLRGKKGLRLPPAIRCTLCRIKK